MATSTTTPAPANYNTGFFSSPADIKNAATIANNTVQAIDASIAQATGAPAGWSGQWATFKSTWDTWYQSKIATASTLGLWAEWGTEDLEGQLTTYEGQIANWGAQLQQYGGTVAGGVPQVEDNSLPAWFPSSGTVITVGALVLATVIAWRVL